MSLARPPRDRWRRRRRFSHRRETPLGSARADGYALSIRLALVVALVAATTLSARAGTLDDPPQGLIPTSTSLAKVHALYLRNHERERTRAATFIEEWRLTQDRMTGTYRVFRLGKDERDVTALGPFVTESGVHAGQHWQQTRNGITFAYAGVHEARDAISDRAWQTADDPHEVRLIGESVTLSAYVVDVNPAGGRHEWLYIDKNSGNIVRREAIAKGRRITTVYDDFRTFDGIPEPSRVRTFDSYGNDREQTLLSRTLDLIPDPKDVDVTPTRHTLVEFPYGSTLVHVPMRVVNGLAVVRVRVGLRFYDFLLDSGAAGIVIDPSVVDDQHLDTYGAHVGATIGTFTETASIVPVLAIGPLKMHGVVTRVVNVPFRLDDRTRIAGLLGFDFFADTIVHLDLDHGVLDAIMPSVFKAPPDAIAVPIALDDRMPAVHARAGSATGRLIVDTGANRSIVGTSFAARADASADAAGSLSRFRSIGGIATAEAVRMKSFDLGGLALGDPVVDVSSADLGTEDIDGTAGTDLVHAYDLFFDYRSAVVYARRTRRPSPGP